MKNLIKIFAFYLSAISLIITTAPVQAKPIAPTTLEGPFTHHQKIAHQVKLPEIKDATPVEVKPVFAWPNTYEWGNCTWYVASQVPVPDTLGNANTWEGRAHDLGYTTSTVPKINAIAQTARGVWGHVAIVEDIQGDQVYLREMNVQGLNVIDHRWDSASNYNFIYVL